MSGRRRRGGDGTPVHIRDFSGAVSVLWRCSGCGETGRLAQALPAACPGCGAPREALGYVTED